MAYDILLADRLREYLVENPNLKIAEKEMFGGLAFLINNKMCINVSGENLMCRFDPTLTESLAEKTGFLPMIMRGKALSGYCYVEPHGFRHAEDFSFWIERCLEFNQQAKSTQK